MPKKSRKLTNSRVLGEAVCGTVGRPCGGEIIVSFAVFSSR
jgi:hypothetical protein